MAAIRHLHFLNFWFSIRLGGLICIVIPNFMKTGLTDDCRYIAFFRLCNIVAVHHLGLLKIDCLDIVFLDSESQCASACKISSKSVKLLLKYSNICFFQDDGHQPFWIGGERVFDSLYHCAKFVRNRGIASVDCTKV